MAEEVKIDTSRGWEVKPNPARGRVGKGIIPEAGQRLKELWADPEWAAALIAKRKAAIDKMKAEGKPFRNRANVPLGMNIKQAKRFWRQAKFEATLTMKKLDKAGVLDEADEQARESLHYAITAMRDPTTPKQHGLQAARLVLDFTKAKPASKSEVTISKAEEWLEAVITDNAKDNSGPTSSA